MARNEGRSRLRRCANSEFTVVPLYSRSLASLRTEKLISQGLRGHAQFIKQRHEVRIGPVVEDDETGVHLQALAADVQRVGVRVAADVIARLVDGDVMFAMQAPCGDVAGDSAADDCDLHSGQRCGTRCTFDDVVALLRLRGPGDDRSPRQGSAACAP